MGDWSLIPDTILLQILNFLSVKAVLTAGLTCRRWHLISLDQILWKHLFYRRFCITPRTPLAPGKLFWYEEYKRLCYHTPRVCSEILNKHYDEVLHVSFSNDGTMFATCSKDGYVVVWNSNYPVNIKYRYDLKVCMWKFAQFSQFNKSDTLLLVTGVNNFKPSLTSGIIAVFSLRDGFHLKWSVGNTPCDIPCDIFGTWYSDRHLLSGNLVWLAGWTSATSLWINKASQDSPTDETPVLTHLYRFTNVNASFVRTVMVADCIDESNSSDQHRGSSGNSIDQNNKESYATNVYQDGGMRDNEDDDLKGQPEKWVIFTTGSKTYTPHQIGFKRMKRSEVHNVLQREEPIVDSGESKNIEQLYLTLNHRVTHSPPAGNPPTYDNEPDEIDHLMDLHGQIIGMSLSPDHRYLYVNSRPWPENYVISNPLDPPPIAREIDIHVIDLVKFCEVGKPLRSHIAYAAHQVCYFIFLDVSEDYVASGAEDRHGYIWDRHYGICLGKFPHNNVVNSVAFNPVDQGMLVSTSGDNEIRVWRSHSFLDETVGRSERNKMKHVISDFKRKK